MGRSTTSRAHDRPFASLESRTRYISGAVVKKKWKKLSSASQENVRDILGAVRRQSKGGGYQKGRKNDSNDAVVIDQVAARLSERLPRMPFPPAANEETFDYELTLHRIQTTEQQLTENVHSMSLLHAQIAREERLLKRDEAEVEQLRTSLRANDALRRLQSKTLHPLVDNLRNLPFSDEEYNALPIIKSSPDDLRGDTSDLTKDETIAPILQQLKNHLDSIQDNTAGMQSIVTCMEDTSDLLRSYSNTNLAAKACSTATA